MNRGSLLVALSVWCATGAALDASAHTHGYLVTSDGLKIHYVVLGHGTPVILIHGGGSSAERSWFANGIAEALAKNHRVVALDCRGHGQSDDPPPGAGSNRKMAEDVIELMDHLHIAKAHVHGYSMGGAVAERLLAHHPERLLSVAFGGWGIPETDPALKAQVPPDREGADPIEAELYAKFRAAVAARKKAAAAGDETTKSRPKRAATGRDDASRPAIDLTRVTIPVLAINGEFDRPNAKTHRLERELANFKNVVLAGKSHMSAAAAGSIPPLYVEKLVEFIDANDPK